MNTITQTAEGILVTLQDCTAAKKYLKLRVYKSSKRLKALKGPDSWPMSSNPCLVIHFYLLDASLPSRVFSWQVKSKRDWGPCTLRCEDIPSRIVYEESWRHAPNSSGKEHPHGKSFDVEYVSSLSILQNSENQVISSVVPACPIFPASSPTK